MPVGKVVYTQWLNARGGIEADLTVTRTADEQFLIVTSGTSQVRDMDWLRRNITAAEVGEAAAFLLSPAASGITATILHVDAGYHAVGV